MATRHEPLAPSIRSVVVIGAGLVGLSAAWLLSRRGHGVVLIDGARGDGARGTWTMGHPQPQAVQLSGSQAALGVLMAGVFHRCSGRAWRLRQHSQVLWRQWRQQLASRGQPIPWRPGLLLLAASPAELERQQALLQDPKRPAGLLRSLGREELEGLWPPPPAAALGGLLSPEDGQLDPLAALEALRADGQAAGLQIRNGWVETLERRLAGWRVSLACGEALNADWVVIAAGLTSTALIPPDRSRAPLALQPVLGQALELELDPADQAGCSAAGRPLDVNWPGAVVWKGMNLIHRHALPVEGTAAGGGTRLWLGATLEPGDAGAPQALERLRELEGDAPGWLQRAREIRRWQGLRARPAGQAAPLLEDLGEGLLLAAGHYRNGVLLAPASAAWVAERIEAGSVPG